MADKVTDSPNQKGLRGAYTKFTQKAENGDDSYADIAKTGMKIGVRGGATIGVGLASIIAVFGLSEYGNFNPENAASDMGLAYGFDNERGYQAIRIDGQDIVLAKDGDNYRVYTSEIDDGERELVLVDDHYEAYAHIMRSISGMESTLEAFENYDLAAIKSVPSIYKFNVVSLPYEHEGFLRRAVDNPERVHDEKTPLNEAFGTSIEQWRVAAEDILADGVAPLQASDGMERPEQEGLVFLQGMAFVLGAGLATGALAGTGFAGGGMTISAARRALHRREKRKRQQSQKAKNLAL